MSIKGNNKIEITSQAILWLALLFSAYMAVHAWNASNETGAGAAQGDLGFYLALRVITPIILTITGVPFLWGLYIKSINIKSALLSRTSLLFYLNTAIVIWCWLYVFYLWK